MPENQHHSTPPEKDAESLEARLQRLEAKLDDSVSQTSAPTHQANNSDRSGIGQAFRLSSEFIAGVVVGAGIGFAFDYYFETSPFGMIFFLQTSGSLFGCNITLGFPQHLKTDHEFLHGC